MPHGAGEAALERGERVIEVAAGIRIRVADHDGERAEVLLEERLGVGEERGRVRRHDGRR